MTSGLKVKQICFPGEGQFLNESETMTLETLNEYHGSYDVDWVVCKDAEGREISRHNCTKLESILWKYPIVMDGDVMTQVEI